MKLAVMTALVLLYSSPLAAQVRPSVAPKNMQEIAPQLADYTDRVLFGDVWVRPELAPRDRSFVVLSALIATGKTGQMAGHLNRGITNGIAPAEIAGMVTHLAFYTGWPNAVSALNVIEQVFADRKIDARAVRSTAQSLAELQSSDMAVMDRSNATVAPKFAELTKVVVLDDLWRRNDLSQRDRSLITIAALAANGDDDQLGVYIRRGLDTGLTRAQIGEALTHLAFYAGWPRASAAIAVAETALRERGASADPKKQKLTVVRPGQDARGGPATNFAGQATVTSPFKGAEPARLGGASVSFQPGSRTNWHTHQLGQLLVVTGGRGWVQAEGEPVREVSVGDVVWTEPGVKHWHGATQQEAFSHVAVAEAAEGMSVTWHEPVSAHHYRGPN